MVQYAVLQQDAQEILNLGKMGDLEEAVKESILPIHLILLALELQEQMVVMEGGGTRQAAKAKALLQDTLVSLMVRFILMEVLGQFI